MGYGAWTESAYVSHSTVSRGYASMDKFKSASAQELYRARALHTALNPYKAKRECRDSDEHPNTVPVILALDVTGSMGSAAEAVAKQLNDIMEGLYKSVADIEFMTMAIGDLSYDRAPIQASQFESDIRIAEQLEKIFFERGGGGNTWESYTAAWYFALHNTELDCWKRGKKGIVITLGDESLNPYLPVEPLNMILGSTEQADIETGSLYEKVCEKFDVYHIAIDDKRTSYDRYSESIKDTFGKLLGQQLCVSTCDALAQTITNIIVGGVDSAAPIQTENTTGISW